jgi:hypothetical protein
VTTVTALTGCVLRPQVFPVSRQAHSVSRIPTTPSGESSVRLRRDPDRFSLCSIDLQSMDLRIVPNSDQRKKTLMSECRFAVSSNRRKAVKPRTDREHSYLRGREFFFGFRSRPRTTSHIGVENMRQIRSRVRNVIGFPASTFCQYRTEYPCESMSSWLSPASSRKRLIRTPKLLKNWDSSFMIPFSKLHALKTTRPI